jgi:hypothetical protein
VCHQFYDNELKFENRLDDEAKLRSVRLLSKKERFSYLFSRLIHSIGELISSIGSTHRILGNRLDVIEIGDFIKISSSKAKRGKKNKDVIFVKVLGLLPSSETLREVKFSFFCLTKRLSLVSLNRRRSVSGQAIFGTNRFLWKCMVRMNLLFLCLRLTSKIIM